MSADMPLASIEFGCGDGNRIELEPRQRAGYFTFNVRGRRGGKKLRIVLTLDDIRALAEFAERTDLIRRVRERVIPPTQLT